MRARTTVVLLEPVLAVDSYTKEQTADWSQAPTEHPNIPASVDPISSSEALLTAGTVITRWVCYLPEGTTVAPTWRVRWRGDDYDVDGGVELHEGVREGYLSIVLKRVEG